MTIMNISGVDIELHADDYGQTINTSKDILALMKMGTLDGISILPNMPCFDACINMLEEALANKELPFLPRISVHIDLVEGRMLSRADGKTIIPWTWKKLFLASYPFISSKTYRAVKEEVRSQLLAGAQYCSHLQQIAKDNEVDYRPQKLRIDSHQHAHMLPVVWKAIMSVIDEEKLEVEYIRNSHEPLGVFFKNKKNAKTKCSWSPVGIIKNRILAFMSAKVEKWYKTHEYKPMYLWGLIMTGHMDMDRIDAVIRAMISCCADTGRNLELNIHPGLMLEAEQCEEIPDESAKTFYLAKENRNVEADTVRRFHDYLVGLSAEYTD